MAKSAIRGLGEVKLWVKDVDEMRRFYVDVLGLTPIHRTLETLSVIGFNLSTV